MTIGDLASKSGVPASTIRYWERIGVLPAAVRIGGQRFQIHANLANNSSMPLECARALPHPP